MKWFALILIAALPVVAYTVIGQSESPEATAYNNGYRLVRQANTTHLLAAYSYRITKDQPYNTLWHLYELNEGEVNWTFLDEFQGAFPSVCIDNYGNWGAAFLQNIVSPPNPPSFNAPYVGHPLRIIIQNNLNPGHPLWSVNIETALLPNGEAEETWFGPPSLSSYQYGDANGGSLIFIALAAASWARDPEGNWWQGYVVFCGSLQIDPNGTSVIYGPFYGWNLYPVDNRFWNFEPAITAYPASAPPYGSFHVVYQSDTRIRYSAGGQSSYISQDGADAKHPSITWFGDKIFATWTEGNPGDGEIVTKFHYWYDDYDEWHPPRLEAADTISHTLTPSDFAVRYGDGDTLNDPLNHPRAIDWQEERDFTSWDIWCNGDINGGGWLTYDDTLDQYPHLNTMMVMIRPFIFTQIYFNVWTKGIQPHDFKVAYYSFTNYPLYSPPRSDSLISKCLNNIGAYYSVNCGAFKQSPYCLKRTGYLRWKSHSVDYDTTVLVYKLPILQPCMHYLARIVVYGDNALLKSPVVLGERLDFDGKADTTISLSSGEPETLYYIIPKELYKDDYEVILSIRGTHGGPVVLENLKLYQFEVLQGEPPIGGPQAKGAGKSLDIPILQLAPSNFKRTITISYQITKNRFGSSLKVYDISGKLVRDLSSILNPEPGVHSTCWNGSNDREMPLPAGIYFIRLETGSSRLTRKAVLVR